MENTELEFLKEQIGEIESNLLLRVDKIEKLPHMPFLKRKLNATLSLNNQEINVTLD